jgi:hypothetical protein
MTKISDLLAKLRDADTMFAVARKALKESK